MLLETQKMLVIFYITARFHRFSIMCSYEHRYYYHVTNGSKHYTTFCLEKNTKEEDNEDNTSSSPKIHFFFLLATFCCHYNHLKSLLLVINHGYEYYENRNYITWLMNVKIFVYCMKHEQRGFMGSVILAFLLKETYFTGSG